ncbi:MAG: translation initiation factor IF-2 [Acidimicrobiia bacterium]|nr:translation initiation factor IF-2 [Acidimicrobiia bacterium]
MAKKRVYELARELGVESKDLVERALELGLEVKTASSGLDEEAEQLLLMALADGGDDGTDEAASSTEKTAPAPEADAEEPAQSAPEEAPQEEPRVIEPHYVEVIPDEIDSPEVLLMSPGILVSDFARMVGRRPTDVVRQLISMGEMVPVAGAVPETAIVELGKHFGFEVLLDDGTTEEEAEAEEPVGPHVVEYEDDPSTLVLRPPVVTVMGHVDHGKTQLLDTIRKANVVAGEAGGITQHIGAYQVEIPGGGAVTFIDTPGHEAFTALRARGAHVTDIVILVVAADDGVKPQTVEAINHTLAADVPMIVAINKMDLPAADPRNVRANLTQHNVIVEDLGGEVIDAEVSALTGDGIDHLLELIGLVAEVEELKANPKAPAVGTVIESQLDVGRGPVATVIVQRGTLTRGDSLVAGPVSGRVRAMFDDKGNQVKAAGPSTPVLVMGWSDVPTAGDMFEAVKNERTARSLAQDNVDTLRARELTVPTATERLGQLLEQLRTADHAELRIIVKADAHGSMEAIRDAVAKIEREDGRVTIIHDGVGGITANDITLADASEAMVYGFNVRPDAGARRAAEDQAIDIRTFSIIYELLEDVENVLVGQLSPESVETLLGVAEVRATFRAPRYGTIAGSMVTEGDILRNAKARLVRQGVVVYDGKIGSLRRFKEDVQSVANGFECGIGLENFRDIKEGDVIESYQLKEVART